MQNRGNTTVRRALVSVIIPSYNRGKVLSRSIDSVLTQSYSNIECIIVDDNSSDDTEDVVKKYKDRRLKYIKLAKNLGACGARNAGIEKAKGEYIAFQDSDDVWHPDKLMEQLKYLEEKHADMCFCSFARINEKKKTIIPSEEFVSPEKAFGRLLMGNIVTTQAILAKRIVFKDIRFDENLPRFQDWDIAVRIAEKFRVVHLNKVLVDVFVQSDSITKSSKKGIKALELFEKKYHNQIYANKEVKLGFLKYKCFLYVDFGCNVRTLAWEYLKEKFNIKIFIFWLVGVLHLEKFLRRSI